MKQTKDSENIKNLRKFSIQISIVVFIAFVIFFSIIYINQREEDIKRFNSVGESSTRRTHRALDTWITNQIRVVKTIAEDPRIVDVCKNPESEESIASAQEYLNEMHERYPYYENLPISVVLDESITRNIQGQEVVIDDKTFLLDTVDNKTLGEGGKEYSYIREIFDGKDHFVSAVYPSILRKKPIFIISAPVKAHGETIGVAVISPKIEYFTEKFITNFRTGETGYLFLVDDRGERIAHHKPEYMTMNDANFLEEKDRLISTILNGERIFEAEFQGDRKHYYNIKADMGQEFSETDWHIVFTQNNGEIFRSTNNLLKGITPALLVLVITMVVVVHFITQINQKEIYEEYLKQTNLLLEKKVKERTRELEKIAITDGLTNLYNQKAIYTEIENSIFEAKENIEKLTIVLVDLDYFKKVNDNYGHLVGDEVLALVARKIEDIVGENGITGRYGGEEFIVVLKVGIEEGIKIANSIRESISNLDFTYPELKVTGSVGACEWRGESSKELVKRADELLYKAKLEGRNRVEAELLSFDKLK